MNLAAYPSGERITAYHGLLFTTCFLSNVLAGMASTLMSVYMPVVVAELVGHVEGNDLNQVGASINALYFIGWAIGGLTWGLIGDRIGRARSLALAVTMYGLFTFLKSLAPTWEWLLAFQFFCGFGVGGVLVLNTTLLSEVWPEKTRAVFIGILSIGFPVGIFSSGAVNFFVSEWREGFMMGALPVMLGLVSFRVLKESERWKTTRQVAKEQVKLGEHKTELVQGATIFGSMLIGLWAIFSWLPTWVQSLLAGSNGQDERGLSMMLLGAGGLTGGFLSGWVANTLGTRRAMLLCFSGCFLFSLLLFKGNHTFTTLTLVETGLLALMFGISQGLLSVYIPLLFPVAIRATATGFCFNIGRFFTAAAVFFVGALVTTLGGYGNSLFAFSFIFLVGFIFIIISKKK
ncbi:MAG: MFS transporter [Cyclobacteriaceae bacterium]|nr:MFS transporter [Cyclobacteriaceae bacterium]